MGVPPKIGKLTIHCGELTGICFLMYCDVEDHMHKNVASDQSLDCLYTGLSKILVK